MGLYLHWKVLKKNKKTIHLTDFITSFFLFSKKQKGEIIFISKMNGF
jgi:hypothetical protein